MIPPHLPRRICDIKKHNQWLVAKNIIIAALFGLFAGICGGAMAVGWIWPMYGGGDTWVVSQNRAGSSQSVLEGVVYKESLEKIFTIYKNTSRVGGLSYFSADDIIGEAVTVSSDGWLAAHLPGQEPAFSAAKWRALGSDGAVYAAEKFLWDSYARTAYIKITPLGEESGRSTVTQFRVAGFEENLTPLSEVYVHEGSEWRFARLGNEKSLSAGARLDSSPSFGYALEGDFTPGSAVINGRGRMVGFVSEDGMLLPSFAVTRIMPSVLNRQTIEYPSFGVTGWLSDEQPAVIEDEKVSGFVVSDVWNVKSKLKKGDVIMEINGQMVLDESLWYNISAPEATLTVSRAGKVFDLSAELFKANPGSVK